jgi:hypothetical protein
LQLPPFTSPLSQKKGLVLLVSLFSFFCQADKETRKKKKMGLKLLERFGYKTPETQTAATFVLLINAILLVCLFFFFSFFFSFIDTSIVFLFPFYEQSIWLLNRIFDIVILVNTRYLFELFWVEYVFIAVYVVGIVGVVAKLRFLLFAVFIKLTN